MKFDKRFTNIFDDEALVVNTDFKRSLKKQLFPKEGSTMKKNKQLSLKELFSHRSFVYSSGLLVLLVLGTGVYALQHRQESAARQSVIEDVVELPEMLDNVLEVDEMRTLAQNDAPAGATIVGIELENEHGKVLYKVKFSDGSFRLYDAVTGLAYVKTEDDVVETDDTVPADFVPGISLQTARDTAQSQRPGKTITKIELDVEEGRVVYSVRFSDDGRVDVDARDGTIVRLKDGKTESSNNSNEDSDDSKDSEDHQEEDTEDDGDTSGSDNKDDEDRSGSNSGSEDDN